MEEQTDIVIDGKSVQASPGISVRKAALRAGIYLPGLCSHPDLDPFKPFQWSEAVWQGETKLEDGQQQEDYPHCNLCLVSIDDGEPERACSRQVDSGMSIRTTGADLTKARQASLKKILTHHPHSCLTCAQKEGCDRIQCSMGVPEDQRCCELLGRCEIGKVAEFIGIPSDTPTYQPLNRPSIAGEPLFVRDYELCIGCTRCVRYCRDVRGVDVLGALMKDDQVWVGTTGGASLPEADCRFCGACVEVCPTGALRDKVGCAPLVEGKAPCTAACPLQIDVPGYMSLIGEGLELDALNLIREQAVLPGVLGYACFHPCEEACRRGSLDEPAAICKLKRYVADVAGDAPLSWDKAGSTGKRIAVVGGGPAGLAASVELMRLGDEVTLYDRDERLGGMLRKSLPDYRLPDRVLDRDLKHLMNMGLEFKPGMALGDNLSLDELHEQYDAVVVALGLPATGRLGVEGEDMEQVKSGLEFLAMAAVGKDAGVHGNVVIIGGGNVAVDCGRMALRLGASVVQVISLEQREDLPAFGEEIAEADLEGVDFVCGWGISHFSPVEDGCIEVGLKKCVQVFDSQGRFRPEYDESQADSTEADFALIAIGQTGELDLPDNLPSGVFTAGDLVTGPSSIVQAMADGKRVARFAHDHAAGGKMQDSESTLPPKSHRIGRRQFLGKAQQSFSHLRTEPDHMLVEERLATTAPYEMTYTREQAIGEASRCLRCHLRADMTPSPLPPDPWRPFTEETAEEIPAEEGVLILADAEKKVAKIIGSQHLVDTFRSELDGVRAVYVRWEVDPMYTKRESELLQAHLKAFGALPGGDDLDDLF